MITKIGMNFALIIVVCSAQAEWHYVDLDTASSHSVHATDIAILPTGAVWVTTSSGAAGKIVNGVFDVRYSPSVDGQGATSVVSHPEDTIWVSTELAGLGPLSNGAVIDRSIAVQGFDGTFGTFVGVDGTGNIWLNEQTMSGGFIVPRAFYAFNGENSIRLGEESQNSWANGIRLLLTDSQGHNFAAVYQMGQELDILAGPTLLYYDAFSVPAAGASSFFDDTLADNVLDAVFDAHDTLWCIGTDGAHTIQKGAVVEGHRDPQIVDIHSETGKKAVGLVADKSGGVWAAAHGTNTTDWSLVRISSGQIQEFSPQSEKRILLAWESVLACDSSANIWVGTSDGLYAFNEAGLQLSSQSHSHILAPQHPYSHGTMKPDAFDLQGRTISVQLRETQIFVRRGKSTRLVLGVPGSTSQR
jgi:streptogramin lyase